MKGDDMFRCRALTPTVPKRAVRGGVAAFIAVYLLAGVCGGGPAAYVLCRRDSRFSLKIYSTPKERIQTENF